jgi:small nuclear ribonucleoprotein (snRNP)-like protein
MVMSKKSEFLAMFVGQEIHVQTKGGHSHRGFVEKSDELKVTFLEKFEPSREQGHNGKEIRVHVFVEDIVMVEVTKTKPR